ncbi:MAG: hypothetical protein BGP21_05225 [Thiobacillus sp. 65-29]|jgi:hypothetical protein|nr:MAG: hypothetical protein BGP21_05225 [Thiobacillus sp. 65-29]
MNEGFSTGSGALAHNACTVIASTATQGDSIMRTITLLSTLALGAGLVGGGILLSPSFAQNNVPSGASTSGARWLSIVEVHDRLIAAGYRNVEKIEREDGTYEARATNRQGERVKLYVNPQSGEIRERNKRESRYGKDASRGDGSGQYAADCNERRCRDDLPQKATPASPAVK